MTEKIKDLISKWESAFKEANSQLTLPHTTSSVLYYSNKYQFPDFVVGTDIYINDKQLELPGVK